MLCAPQYVYEVLLAWGGMVGFPMLSGGCLLFESAVVSPIKFLGAVFFSGLPAWVMCRVRVITPSKEVAYRAFISVPVDA